MKKKTLEIFYTTLLKKDDDEVFSHILTAVEEKIDSAGTGHKVNFSTAMTKKQLTARINRNINIIARITSHSTRSESLKKMPKTMKIFEETKKEMKKSHGFTPEMLSTLAPEMYVHTCTVEIGVPEDMEKKYDVDAKRLISRITRNKVIILLG